MPGKGRQVRVETSQDASAIRNNKEGEEGERRQVTQ
jgi:hypothetical protein